MEPRPRVMARPRARPTTRYRPMIISTQSAVKKDNLGNFSPYNTYLILIAYYA